MDKLSEIMAAKRREIEPIIRPVRDSELSTLGERIKDGPSFLDALSSSDELSVIAEIKRKSPSAGEIASEASAVEQARPYSGRSGAFGLIYFIIFFLCNRAQSKICKSNA